MSVYEAKLNEIRAQMDPVKKQINSLQPMIGTITILCAGLVVILFMKDAVGLGLLAAVFGFIVHHHFDSQLTRLQGELAVLQAKLEYVVYNEPDDSDDFPVIF